MRRWMILLAAVAGGFLVGWLGTPGTASLAGGPAAGPARPPALAHAGGSVSEAVRRFSDLGLAVPEAPPPPMEPISDAPSPPPPPPPIDIAEAFSRDLTAVVRAADGPSLWLVDESQPDRRRQVRPGDAYRDGWIVRAIDPQYVELGRRKERRRIAVYGAAPVAYAGTPVGAAGPTAPTPSPSPEIVIGEPTDRLFLRRPK